MTLARAPVLVPFFAGPASALGRYQAPVPTATPPVPGADNILDEAGSPILDEGGSPIEDEAGA